MKKILSLLLLVSGLFCVMFFGVNSASMYYSVSGIADYYSIEPSEGRLNDAYNQTTMNIDELEYCGCFSRPYQLHIYKFKPSTDGYYSFYTAGATGTVIKLYQRGIRKALLKKNRTPYYTEIGSSKGGCKIDVSTNASLVMKLSKDVEYMVCVRAHSRATGYYDLYCGGNEDLVHKTEISGQNLWQSNNPTIGKPYRRQYLNTWETLVLYLLLTGKYDTIIGDNAKLKAYSYKVDSTIKNNKPLLFAEYVRNNDPSDALDCYGELVMKNEWIKKAFVDYFGDSVVNGLSCIPFVGCFVTGLSEMVNLIEFFEKREAYSGKYTMTKDKFIEFIEKNCMEETPIDINVDPYGTSSYSSNKKFYQGFILEYIPYSLKVVTGSDCGMVSWPRISCNIYPRAIPRNSRTVNANFYRGVKYDSGRWISDDFDF